MKVRLTGALYRTLGDSILPNSIEDGVNLISIAKDSMHSDTTLNLNTVRKKERQLRNLERQLKNEFGLTTEDARISNNYALIWGLTLS